LIYILIDRSTLELKKMATTYYTDIQKLYVAYFNRPADVAGLQYWETVVEANKGNTAAVSAAFAASAEYKTTYAGQTNEQIVNTVYLNLFSHAADAPGQAYWADLLTRNKITIDSVVTQIATGALTTDLTAYNNKVIAAGAFTAALDLPAEQAGYANPLANPAAKAFLSGVTTDISLQAALAPATLNASVAAVVAAGTPFTLNGALSTYQAATDAKAAFLDVALDGKVGGTVSVDADITANVATKMAAVDAIVAGTYATTTSANVNAALLADQVAANAKALSDAQVTVATDNANIAKVAGLTAAINAQTATAANETAAIAVDKLATADVAAKLAAYNSLNTATATVGTDGQVTGLITLDTAGHLVLATSVTETTNPGVTALLNASIALEAADATVTSAHTASLTAVAQVNYLDQSAAEKADLTAIAGGLKNVTLAAGAQVTLADIATEKSILAAKAAADPTNTTLSGDVTTFNNLVTTYNNDSALAASISNPLSSKLTTDTTAVTTATANIKALSDAVAALNTANGVADQLAAVNASIAAANKAFTDHSLTLPVVATGSLIAGAGSDIYVAGSTAGASSIALFGLQGNDSLFIGSKYTLNTGAFATAGNDSVLEAFFVQNGSNVDIKLETKAFGSNSTDGEVVITLTGTTVDHVHLANGIITVA
jgi:hypothetical protein